MGLLILDSVPIQAKRAVQDAAVCLTSRYVPYLKAGTWTLSCNDRPHNSIRYNRWVP